LANIEQVSHDVVALGCFFYHSPPPGTNDEKSKGHSEVVYPALRLLRSLALAIILRPAGLQNG